MKILDEAAGLVRNDRQADYGHPRDDFAKTAKIWSGVLGPKLKEEITPQDVALCMVGIKLSREVHRHKRDNIVDAIGYLLTLAMIEGEDE